MGVLLLLLLLLQLLAPSLGYAWVKHWHGEGENGGWGIAISDSGEFFWSSANQNSIGRATRPDGAGSHVIADASKGVAGPRGIALAGNELYWANMGSSSIQVMDLAKGTVSSLPPNCTNEPRDVQSTGDWVVWGNTNEGSIGVHSRSANRTTCLSLPVESVDSIAVLYPRVVWGSKNPAMVGWLRLSTQGWEAEAFPVGSFGGVAIAGGEVVWGSPGNSSIFANPASPRLLYKNTTVVRSPDTMASSSDGTVYWTNLDGDAPVAWLHPTGVAGHLPTPTGGRGDGIGRIATLNGMVAWTTSNQVWVMKV